jgi:type IV secretory pathway VirB6-like protein
MAVLLVAACSGPNNHSSCIPDNTGGGSNASGGQIQNFEEIDKKLREKKIISTIVDKIKTTVVGNGWNGGAAQKLFDGFVNSSAFRAGISAAFSLYIIFYGVMLIGGMIQVTLGDAAIRMLKVSFVTYLGLNWSNFYGTVGSASIAATDELIGYMLSAFSGSSVFSLSVGGVTMNIGNVFTGLDELIAQIFSIRMMAVISALFMAGGPSTPMTAIIMLISTYFVLMAIVQVVLVYCFSLFARALLFAVGPIFLAFMLFSQTRPLFDMWVKMIVNHTMQPVFVAVCVGMFMGMISEFLSYLSGLKVCWRQLEASKEVYGWVFVDDNYQRVNFGTNTKPIIELQIVLLYFCFAYIFYGFQKVAQSMATGLTNVVSSNLFEAAKLENLQGFMKAPNKGSQLASKISR